MKKTPSRQAYERLCRMRLRNFMTKVSNEPDPGRKADLAIEFGRQMKSLAEYGASRKFFIFHE